MGFGEPSDTQAWAEAEDYLFEIWTDDERTLALAYGAIASVEQSFPLRVSFVLDGNGDLLLEYRDSVSVGTHPDEVLSDCQALFGD